MPLNMTTRTEYSACILTTPAAEMLLHRLGLPLHPQTAHYLSLFIMTTHEHGVYVCGFRRPRPASKCLRSEMVHESPLYK